MLRFGLDSHRLYVIDLSGSDGRRRRLVRALARSILAFGNTVRSGVGLSAKARSRSAALVYAPHGGDTVALLGAAGFDVLRPEQILSAQEFREINEWAYAASLEIVRGDGRKLFPTAFGVSLGDLNLPALQGFLSAYGALVASIRAALADRDLRRCTIFTGSRLRAQALQGDVSDIATRVHAWYVPALPSARFATLTRTGADRLKEMCRDRIGTLMTASRGMGTPRVLILSETGAMSQMFEVVEHRLCDAGIGPVMRIQYGSRREPVRLTARTAVAFLPAPAESRPVVRGRYRRQWREARRAAAEFEFRPLSGRKYSPPLRSLLKGLYQSEFDRQFEHLIIANEILAHLQPELLVVGNDRWVHGQGFVQLARQRGIPTLCVQDGVAGDLPFWYWMTADHLAASGKFLAELLERHGFPPTRYTVTGQPRYDGLWASRQQDGRSLARQRLGLDQSAFYALFATQPLDSSYQHQVIQAVLAVPTVKLLVRPHPSLPRGAYRMIAAKYASERVSLQESPDIFDLVRAVDLVITHSSTVTLEAAILHKPVITAHFSGVHDSPPFAERGLAINARTPAELAGMVAQFANGAAPFASSEEAARSLTDFVGPGDGRAGDRVAGLIAEMLQRQG